MGFSLFEEKIIIILGRNIRPLSINEIAAAAGISWITARKHIGSLEKRGVIRRVTEGKRPRWKLNLPAIENG